MPLRESLADASVSAESNAEGREKNPFQNIASIKAYFADHPKFRNYLSGQRDQAGDVDHLSKLKPDQYAALWELWRMMPDKVTRESSYNDFEEKFHSHFGVPEIDIRSSDFLETLKLGPVVSGKVASTVVKRDRGDTAPIVTDENLEKLYSFINEKFDRYEKEFDSSLESMRKIISSVASSERGDDFHTEALKSSAESALRFFESIPMNMISEDISSTLHLTKCNLITYIDLINEMQDFKPSLPEQEFIFQRGEIIAERFGKRLYVARTTLENLFRILQNKQKLVTERIAVISEALGE